MIPELEPVWKQFGETYDAVRQVLNQAPDERLTWRPGPKANTVARIIQHLASANIRYARMIEHGEPGPRLEPIENPARQLLLQRVEESEQRVRETFDQVTPESLREIRADGWGPLGLPVEGPLDCLWFAMQMVRHSAYHLGQLNVYLLMWEGEAAE
jgi:uncharacterized damage-inducible protein DinB